jgi:ribonuclease VapC
VSRCPGSDGTEPRLFQDGSPDQRLESVLGYQILDTSAVLAILQDEAERTEFVSLIEHSSRRLISAVSVLEAAMVLEGRKGAARTTFRRFGEGRHAAGLNFGDCASYALAQWSGEPLLFKGSDFEATDVARVRE